MNKKDIKVLLSELCCCACKRDFDKDSLVILNNYKGNMVCKLVCKNCGKDFGEIVLGVNEKSLSHSALLPIEGGAPISFDDVIDAHRFISEKL